MAEETGIEPSAESAEPGAGNAGSEEKTKGKKKTGEKTGPGYQDLAEKYLRRALRSLGDEGEPNAQADFFLRAANTYATLELARSFRPSAENAD